MNTCLFRKDRLSGARFFQERGLILAATNVGFVGLYNFCFLAGGDQISIVLWCLRHSKLEKSITPTPGKIVLGIREHVQRWSAFCTAKMLGTKTSKKWRGRCIHRHRFNTITFRMLCFWCNLPVPMREHPNVFCILNRSRKWNLFCAISMRAPETTDASHGRCYFRPVTSGQISFINRPTKIATRIKMKLSYQNCTPTIWP